jgi:hypothetical protein
MELVKSSDVEFAYPVLGITPDSDLWAFCDKGEMTTCGKLTLQDDMQKDMDLIDAQGGSWRVVSLLRLGGVGLSYGLSCFLAGVSRVEHDLRPLPRVNLEDVKARVCACMAARPEDWIWPDVGLPERLAEVEAVTSIAGIHEVLGLDHFRAY